MPTRHPIDGTTLALWRFDNASGDVPDLSGNGNTAVEFGTVPAQSGQFGGARGRFTQSDYFVAADSPSLRPTAFTFSAWAYWASSSQNPFAKPAGKDNLVNSIKDGPYQFNDTGSGLVIDMAYADGNVTAPRTRLTPGAVSVGWHHIGVTLDASGKISVYFDGSLADTNDMPGGNNVFHDASGLWFGRDANAGSASPPPSGVNQSFNGWLEEVALYSEAKDICFFASIADGAIPVPIISGQDPAPGSSMNPPNQRISFDVSEPTLGVSLSGVEVYVNDSLAFTRSRGLPGFDVNTSAVTDGQTFDIGAVDQFEPGEQSVRVLATPCPLVDGSGLDETYSFSTTTFPDVSAETTFDEPTSGIDLRLDGALDISVAAADLQLAVGIDEVIQHLKVGLLLYRGEWFLDTEAGIPYYVYILVNNPNTKVVEGIFRRNIIEDSDIEELSSFEMEFDRATRKLDIDFKAKSSVGVVELSSVFP